MRRTWMAVMLSLAVATVAAVYPDPSHQDVVQPLVAQLDAHNIEQWMVEFTTSWPNRFYDNEYGVASQQWLLQQIATIADNDASVTVEEWQHDAWLQNSIIATLHGSGNHTDVVVLGAHLDSTINSPGADDNSSGSVSVLEVFRALVESGFRPDRSIEFHWYAAEEAGLLGSREVAKAYKGQGIDVYGMLSVDMDGYSEATGVHVVDGANTESHITEFLAKTIEEYGGVELQSRGNSPPGNTDSRAWVEQGYAGCFGIEYPKSPYSHTPQDNLDNVSFDFVYRFTWHVLGFVVELALQ